MLADYGFYLLLLAFISNLFGIAASTSAVLSGQKRFFHATQAGSLTTMALAIGAAAVLVTYLLNGDFSLGYVFRNSSLDLPLRYRISAFWAALEGSHFLWTIIFTACSTVAHFSYSRANAILMPYVSIALNVILACMYFLLVSHSDPFALQFPTPTNGLGLNTLLQNPYMVFHPPALFLGYSACAIPFAYACAVLCLGDIPKGWLRTVRRWALFAWSFLTLGIFLGGRWAYVELGWAGYWAWDPVENSSFLPWLFTTMLLHALFVQERTGQLKHFTLIVAFLSLFFSFFGTFITRSGIISSVHSFAQSPVGPFYLYYLLALAVAFLILYALRAKLILPAASGINLGLSKETLLIMTQYLLGLFAVIVVIGTLYPIVSEIVVGSRIDVQAPYFNTFAPYIGFALAIGIVLGNLLRFGSKGLGRSKTAALLLALPTLFASLVFLHCGDAFRSVGYAFAMQFVGTWLCFWGISCLVYDLFVRLKYSFGRQTSYIGATVAHIGVYIAILGFLGNYRGLDTLITLKAGESTNFYGYDMRFSGVRIEKQENAELYVAPLHFSSHKGYKGTVKAARAKYPTKDELINEIGIYDSFWHDLYVVLADFSRSGTEATFQIFINPTVKIVWISVFFLLLGSLICLGDRYRGLKPHGEN